MQNRCHAVGKAAAEAFSGMLLVRSTALLLTLFTSALQAQTAPDLQYLIFDAVPLDSVEPAPAVAPAPDVGESDPDLASPATEAADIRAWLDLRQRADAVQEPDALTPDITRYQRVLAEIELAQGPYAPGLDQELLALGTLHQQVGDHTSALAALERAIHINRVNNGLFNLGQTPIIEKAIENHLARGDLVAADTQQEYLFYLQRKALGDTSVALLPALTRYAEWNVFAYNAQPQLLTPPPQAEGTTAAAGAVDTTAVNLETFRYRRLIMAQNLYQSVIGILVDNFGTQDPRLPEFERRLAVTNYFFATTFDPSMDYGSAAAYASLMPYDVPQAANNSLGYREGKDALERRIDYLANAETPDARALARAHIDLGDWYLRFRKRTGALEAYQEAHTILSTANVPQAEIDVLLKPPLPAPVPDFLIHPYSRQAFDIPDDAVFDYKGHIDVEFTLNRYGAPGTIKVLDKDAATPNNVESRLLRNIRRNIYRPRHDDGVVRDADLVRLRYYYTY